VFRPARLVPSGFFDFVRAVRACARAGRARGRPAVVWGRWRRRCPLTEHVLVWCAWRCGVRAGRHVHVIRPCYSVRVGAVVRVGVVRATPRYSSTHVGGVGGRGRERWGGVRGGLVWQAKIATKLATTTPNNQLSVWLWRLDDGVMDRTRLPIQP